MAAAFLCLSFTCPAQTPDSILAAGHRYPVALTQHLADSLALAIDRLKVEPAIPFAAKYIFTAQKTFPGSPSSLGQEARLSLGPRPGSAFKVELGLKTERFSAADYSQGLSLLLDEACVWLQPRPWVSASLGRIYFVLDRLGLLADNINDAFEGASLDLDLFGQRLGLAAVASRQSSTNYPFRRFFVSVDDYYAGRLSLDLDRLALGGTWLASGIASEKGFGADLYLRIGDRQLAAEYARYRPSESSWFQEIVWRQAWVAGSDLINSGRLNVFLQAADIDQGFTPMASSLLYSSGGRHLYFDQNTFGADLTASYRLGEIRFDPNDALIRGAKPDRNYSPRPTPVAEAEWVSLWDQGRRPHSHRFIGRLVWPLGSGINIFSECWLTRLRREPSGDLCTSHGVNLNFVLSF